ncbi:MAG: transaldolase, partial [Ignavibacteriales bacterium]|nr:transaldolase [Ignavibacteriales bacterium]
ASVVLGINPFDQPDVQLAKTLATESLEAYKASGALPVETPLFVEKNIKFFGSVNGTDTRTILLAFLQQAQKDDYVCLQGFVPYSSKTDEAVANFRKALLTKLGLCSTFGYGPRFLHSTGQLHKGGQNQGLFIQLTDEISKDIPVSGQGYSFGTLITAQAQGDAKALISRNRRFLKLQINGSVAPALDILTSAL